MPKNSIGMRRPYQLREATYSNNGYILAGTQNRYLAYLEPKVVSSEDEVAHNLADVLIAIKKMRGKDTGVTFEYEYTGFWIYQPRFVLDSGRA